MNTQFILALLTALGLTAAAGLSEVTAAPPVRPLPANFPAELLPVGSEGLPDRDQPGNYNPNRPNGGRAIGWDIPADVLGDSFGPIGNRPTPVATQSTPVENRPPEIDASGLTNDDMGFFVRTRAPVANAATGRTQRSAQGNSAWPSGLLDSINRTQRDARRVGRIGTSGR